LKLRKCVFRKRKCRKFPIFYDVGIQYFEVIYEEQVMAHIQNNTKHNFQKKKISTFSLREIDAEKTLFQAAKTQKMTNFFMTFEFKILR
jgi:hypothetical protein